MAENPNFGVVWRGYHRGQVEQCLDELRAELAEAKSGHEAVVSQVEDLEKQIAVLLEDNQELQAALDRVCLAPIEADGLTERLRHMMELARLEATEIKATAHAQRARDEKRRKQAEQDFELAMSARRREALREIEAQKAEAAAEAERVLAEARERSDEAESVRAHILSQLEAANKVLEEDRVAAET
ncbi:hypothetical protein [Amycolatopsis magusensis]|uniref:hypothetical protein n=1 Tax=Amycolatopsis magusensis TaxID=882444 RepID=UPI003C2D0E71